MQTASGDMTALNSVAAFRALSPQGKALLERGRRIHHVEAACSLIEKGDPVSGAYFVLSGRLRVFTMTPGGREATLYLLGPGDTCVLALNSLFNRLAYPAWVESETATTLAVVSGEAYRQLFESEAAIRDLTINVLSGLVFRLMSELEEVHGCTVEQRLANFILTRADGDGILHKTQQELADHIGTSREVVARLAARWGGEGVIATGRGVIRLQDRRALRALSGVAEPPTRRPSP